MAAETDEAIAVLIPTLNEAGRIGPLLQMLLGAGFSEVIVADGGSTDGTQKVVRSFPDVVCIEAPRGRGKQLRAAVSVSQAPLLFMLHADTLPPAEAAVQIRAALRQPKVAAGCFRLRFDCRSRLMDFYAWCSRFETRFTTFGDQGYFMRRNSLEVVGGVPDWLLLEDVELRRRLRLAGRFVKLESAVVTSARRFEARGALRGQLRNFAVMAGYWCGVKIERLHGFYGVQGRF